MVEKAQGNETRRRFLLSGVGAVGGAIAARSLAQVCEQKPTGPHPLGPFFPRPGTPDMEVREDQNPNVPIYLANDNDLTFVQGKTGSAIGQVVYLRGKVVDDACDPIPNAVVVIWQASSTGRYNHLGDGTNHDFVHPKTGKTVKRILDPNFQYWGRTTTNEKGEYIFKTIVPGFYPADLNTKWYRPPHIHALISANGYPQLVTQMYFRGEKISDNEYNQELNKADLLLQSPQLTDAERENLIVDYGEDPDRIITDGLVGQFDITLKR